MRTKTTRSVFNSGRGMKTSFRFLAAVAISLLAFVGCQKETSTSDDTTRTVHFKVHAGAIDTRTGVIYEDGSYVPYWNPGDEIIEY